MVVDEEILQFAAELLAKIPNRFYVGKAVSVFFDCNDTVIAFLLFLGALLPLDDSNGAALVEGTNPKS